MKPDEGTERLLEDLLVDAYGEDEMLWAFRQAFEDEVAPPVEGFVIGETVSVTNANGLVEQPRSHHGGRFNGSGSRRPRQASARSTSPGRSEYGT